MEHFSRELEEYRMLKHLFGATFSPSIANFCLKKTAELDGEGFEEQTVETVQRNVCRRHDEVNKHYREGSCAGESTPGATKKRWFPFDKVV